MQEINKILFITLSNIGDCILTLPVLDLLRGEFPRAQIIVLSGQRPKEIFQNNPYVNRLIIYDKHACLKDKIRLFKELKREDFDIVIDLRNSLLGALLTARKKTSPFMIMPKQIRHMKDRHLYRVMAVMSQAGRSQVTQRPSVPAPQFSKNNFCHQDTKTPDTSGHQLPSTPETQSPVTSKKQEGSLYIREEDERFIDNILKENGITDRDKIAVIAPGARSHIKRWPQDKFAELVFSLAKEFKFRVILVGDKDDAPITKYMAENCTYPILDLSGKTAIMQLASLLKKSQLVISNDSATLHLASYLNLPTVAIFGPTNEIKYGPWSGLNAIAKKDIFCRPCEKAQCQFGTLRCMQLIKVEDVLKQVKNVLERRTQSAERKAQNEYKRILIVRTDRIGDVLLSTPVIKALRDNYPGAYIAAMVSPYARDILDGNLYLDEVIIYDKDGKHKSWLSSIRFSHNLGKKGFDLAIILHPTNRVHLVTSLACIPRRIGYDRKLGFLLTDRIRHTKQLGEKHELEYALDLVRYLDIDPKDKNLFMPVKPESERWVEELFKQKGIDRADKLLAIHPGASCPSKIWPNERFAEVADRLIERYGLKILLVSGPGDAALIEKLIKNTHNPVINLAGKTSVSQLASILKRCQLFISNDSGPVHIASALGTPVISIFGRNQKGLSPLRWGPIGKKDKILHKEVGCIECLAHNCIKDFACLKAVTVDDVLSAADSILKTD